MNMKLFATTALAASLIAGVSFAQSTPDAEGQVGASTTSESNDATTTNNDSMKADDSMQSGDAMESMDFASDDEKMMYEKDGPLMAGFFTDESMTEMKSEDEVAETFAAMGADDQAEIKAACDRAMGNRGSYGTVTVGLCEQVGAL